MTIHQPIPDMSVEPFEDDDMARRVSPEQFARLKSGVGDIAATRIVAKGYKFDDGSWGAQFALPGRPTAFLRDSEGSILGFETEGEAEGRAMRAAIDQFNAPRERMVTGRSGRTSDVRPAKLSAGEIRAILMQIDGIGNNDIAYLLDKPVKRVVGWIDGEQDLPHEIRLLFQTWLRFDEAVDFAFEITNKAVNQAAGD